MTWERCRERFGSIKWIYRHTTLTCPISSGSRKWKFSSEYILFPQLFLDFPHPLPQPYIVSTHMGWLVLWRICKTVGLCRSQGFSHAPMHFSPLHYCVLRMLVVLFSRNSALFLPRKQATVLCYGPLYSQSPWNSLKTFKTNNPRLISFVFHFSGVSGRCCMIYLMFWSCFIFCYFFLINYFRQEGKPSLLLHLSQKQMSLTILLNLNSIFKGQNWVLCPTEHPTF